MSTRGLYTFKDQYGSFNVYKHSDNYPSGAAEAIEAAIKHAWELPRFEADEFGAAFIRGNKTSGGNLRLMPCGKPNAVANKHCSDIEYRYEIFMRASCLMIAAYSMHGVDKLTSKLIFECERRNLHDTAAQWETAHNNAE